MTNLLYTDWKPWLRKLAAKGGKGVVGNIDARCLGRLADDLAWLEENLKACQKVCAMKQAQIDQLLQRDQFRRDYEQKAKHDLV